VFDEGGLVFTFVHCTTRASLFANSGGKRGLFGAIHEALYAGGAVSVRAGRAFKLR
jgi:hypothetical protein